MLLLKKLPKMKKLLLCDLPVKADHLQKLRDIAINGMQLNHITTKISAEYNKNNNFCIMWPQLNLA